MCPPGLTNVHCGFGFGEKFPNLRLELAQNAFPAGRGDPLVKR
jgi:hypothetical protein